jgi:hypothetical protein
MKLIVLLTLMATPAFAGAPCKSHPKEEWIKEETFKKKLLDDGYKIKKFKIDGNCYEIYGTDKDGKKVEIYFDTKDGSIVKSESH